MKIRTLRQRLIIVTVIIITLTSTLFAGGVFAIKQMMEEITFGDMVHDQLMVLVDHPEWEPILESPLFKRWQYYRGDNVNELSASVQNMAPGVYHAKQIEDRHYHLQIVDTDTGKAYLLYDISDWEQQEHLLLTLLLMGVFLVLGLALLMASASSSRILEPVHRLTQRLRRIDPSQRQLRIADEFSDSDIGLIATAFDTYLERIDNFVERERSFTATASHELRTPLSVMMGAVDVIEANHPDPASSRALTRMGRACGDMQAFIEAALLLSREEDVSLQRTSSSQLCELLQQLLEDLQPQIETSDIDIQLACEKVVRLPVSESISKILLSNLLRNAIEHTKGGQIHISLRPEEFIIRDNGRGIPAEDLPHVFERSYSNRPEGTGLGLYMVKRICERYGWPISIESEKGQGTTVSIKFQ